MDNNICFLLSSCDAYSDLWRPFCTQLLKYWSGFDLPIYLCTETKSFQYDGLRIEAPLQKYNTDLSSWSKRLEVLLSELPYDYFIFMIEDLLLTEEVKVEEVEKAYNYLKSDKTIGLIHLWPLISANSDKKRRDNAVDSKFPEYHLIKGGMPYRINAQVAIWRKDYMLKVLRSHETAWQFEIRGSIRSRFLPDKILATKKQLFQYPEGGLLWRGKCQHEVLKFFDKDLIAESIEKRGVIEAGAPTMYKKSPRDLKFFWRLIKSFIPLFRK